MILLTVLIVFIAFTSAAEEQCPESNIERSPAFVQFAQQKEIVKLTEEIIEAINRADMDTYNKMVAPYVTSFEPEAMGNLVEGMEFHKFYFDNHLGKICHAMRTNILTPRVHLLGEDVAVIAYIRLTQCADRHGHAHSVPSEETRVWHKRDGQWQMVHLHRSSPK